MRWGEYTRRQVNNDLDERIIDALASGAHIRMALCKRVLNADVGVLDCQRALARLRRGGIVRFSGVVDPGQVITLAPEWQ